VTAIAGGAARTAFVSFTYSAVSMLPLFVVSSLAVTLQRELGFGEARLGLAVSICFVTSALSAGPVGRAVQRFGAPITLRFGALVTLTALVCLATAGSWWQLALGLALGGLGNAIAMISASASVALDVPAARHGLGFGIQQAAVPATNIAVGLSVPLLTLLFGWHAAFVAAGVAAVALVAAGRALHPPARREAGPGERVRLTRPLALIAIVGMLGGMVGNSLAAFLVDSAHARGFSEAHGALLLACASAAAFSVRIGLGWLADRRRSAGLTELACLMALGALAFALAAADTSSDSVYVLAMLLGLASSWGWPGLVYTAAARRSSSHPGPTAGFLMSWIFAGNVVGPFGTGVIVEHWSYTGAWLTFVVLLAVAAAAAAAAERLS
jgi:MFS family permease